ncbi:MAG: hypothetical protein II937_12165 [Bacteroidales bacterium]|nr:hypothetical protein [Bacteroidales bacterium]
MKKKCLSLRQKNDKMGKVSFKYFLYTRGRKLTFDDVKGEFCPIYLRIVTNRQSFEMSFSNYVSDYCDSYYNYYKADLSHGCMANVKGVECLNNGCYKDEYDTCFIGDFSPTRFQSAEIKTLLKMSDNLKKIIENIIKYVENVTKRYLFFKEVKFANYLKWFNVSVYEFFVGNMFYFIEYTGLDEKTDKREIMFFKFIIRAGDELTMDYNEVKKAVKTVFDTDLDTLLTTFKYGAKWKHICNFIDNDECKRKNFAVWYNNDYDKKDEIINDCIKHFNEVMVLDVLGIVG